MPNETNLGTLPKEVADAIESLKSKGYPAYEIMKKGYSAPLTNHAADGNAIFDWAHKEEGRLYALMYALVNGYQVEATPEEKVRKYYEGISNEQECSFSPEDYRYPLEAIRTTLNLLGIQIEGVNA